MQSLLLLAALIAAEPDKPFAISVVDSKTNRGVPLIELKTVNGIRLVADSNGVVAFHEPGLMNETVFFHIAGHGYEYPKDGFGIRGKQVKIEPGGSFTLKVDRINIAERLYRITGGGLYRDSFLTGIKAPIKEPLLNAQVVGSDSVMNAIYRGKLHWFWGDTLRPSYPLGNFHVPGATSALPGKGGLDPDVGIDLTYFVDDKGFAKKTCEMPGKGPTWLTSLVVLPGPDGRERMYGTFVKVEPPLKLYSRGLAVWDDDKRQFEKIRDIDMAAPIFPMGHATRHGDHVYFAHPYPLTRMPATGEAFADPNAWETFTPLKDGSASDLDRDADGKLRYAWRKKTPAVGPAEQAKLVSAGKMKAAESPINLRDRDTGKPVTAHGGSVAWNEYRKRWTLLFVEHNGKQSFLGEVWYAEADELTGPWRYAVKVATHDRMSFYNPKQHPELAKEGGRVIYFEGTYTHDFSSNPDVTPRYEYNQLMYRLDLGDTRTALPRPVPGTDFMALDRQLPGSIPLPDQPQVFMLPDDKTAPAATVPLHSFTNGETKRYGVAERMAGFERSKQPVGRLWPLIQDNSR
ncbi:MAG TPA: hypothetical protein VHR66_29250 [Gemmataceae bacterium]|jgi:hypothetical protein|nr:hypothetical protein [Gemmataceae bacterium]